MAGVYISSEATVVISAGAESRSSPVILYLADEKGKALGIQQ